MEKFLNSETSLISLTNIVTIVNKKHPKTESRNPDHVHAKIFVFPSPRMTAS